MQNENRIELLRPTPQAVDRRRSSALASFDDEIGEAPNLLSYWAVIRKRRWTVLAVLAFVFAGVLIFTLKETPLYEGTVVIEIEKENPNIVTADDLFGVDSVNSTFLETQYKILQSDSLARSVIRDLSLQRFKEFNPPRHWWSLPQAKLPREPKGERTTADTPTPDSNAMYNALRVFHARLDIEPWKQSRLVEVTFDSRDPLRAAEIANTLAANYIDQNLQLRWDAAQKASEWLSQQLVGVKVKLEKSEDEMQAYARNNGLLFLESEKGTTENIVDSRLRELQSNLTAAQANLYQTESLYRLTQDGDQGALPGVFEDHEIQELTLRLSDLNAQKALMATTFTPDYPKLKQLQNEIDDVQQTLASERQRGAQNIKDDYEAAVHRVTLLQGAFASAQHDANEIAEKSVQYNILKREVDTNRQLYDGLLDRMKQAGVAAGIKDSNIRVVDPAVPPRKPARPRTTLNLSLGLMVGLALGVGAAFLEEHLDHNHLAGFLDMVMPLALALALYHWRKSRRRSRRSVSGLFEFLGDSERLKSLLLALAAALMLVSIVFSFSRMGIISALFSLAVMAAVISITRCRGVYAGTPVRALLIVSFLTAVVVIVAWLGVGPVVHRFELLPQNEPLSIGGQGRIALWHEALPLLRAYPWAGIGLGGFPYAFTRLQDMKLTFVFDYAHNDYLQLAIELGIPCAAALFALIDWIVFRTLLAGVRSRSEFTRAVALGSLAGAAALLLHTAADFNLYIPANALVFASVLGLGYAQWLELRSEVAVNVSQSAAAAAPSLEAIIASERPSREPSVPAAVHFKESP